MGFGGAFGQAQGGVGIGRVLRDLPAKPARGLEGQGLRTRGQKSGKLTLVMVHMRGTDLDAANLKEELQRMRLGSPLQKSKKRVGGKPRPR